MRAAGRWHHHVEHAAVAAADQLIRHGGTTTMRAATTLARLDPGWLSGPTPDVVAAVLGPMRRGVADPATLDRRAFTRDLERLHRAGVELGATAADLRRTPEGARVRIAPLLSPPGGGHAADDALLAAVRAAR